MINLIEQHIFFDIYSKKIPTEIKQFQTIIRFDLDYNFNIIFYTNKLILNWLLIKPGLVHHAVLLISGEEDNKKNYVHKLKKTNNC